MIAPVAPVASSPDGPAAGAPLETRTALLSILGFWLFYFAIVSVRWLVVGGTDDQGDILVRRMIVTVASAGATVLLYLALRRLPRRSLGFTILIVALLAVPAALLYSTVNWLAFRAVDERHAAARTKTAKTVVIDAPRGDGRAHGRPGRQITVETLTADGVRAKSVVVEQDMTPRPATPANGGTRLPPLPPEAASTGGGVPLPPLPPPPAGSSRRITIQVGGADDDTETSPLESIVDNAANGYFFIVAWAALYLALSYAAEVRAAERRAAGFRAAAQAAEIRALRYQVNPHFLFNTLNSLSSLVLAGKVDQAERVILNLATFFRTSLTGDPTEDMRLDEEIRLQRLYLDIETVRFPERMAVEIDVPPALASACVPGLILQPLIENAVKYGVSRARRPVTIRIVASAEDGVLRLDVADDGDPPPIIDEQPAGTGLGLRNVRERIAARFGPAGSCRWGARPGGGFVVTLTMPIVRRGC